MSLQKESEWEKEIKKHLKAVEEEYQMVGLSDGLYGDYATEVARRAVSQREKEIADEVDRLLPKDWAEKAGKAKKEGDMYTGGFFMGMIDTVEKAIDIIVSQREKEIADEVKKKVGLMRQWLNEDRITDNNKMVTSEELLHWLKH